MYKLINYLPGCQYNRKLFYIDADSFVLPSGSALDTIDPGSICEYRVDGTKYYLASNKTWVKQQPLVAPTSLEGGPGYTLIGQIPGSYTNAKLFYIDDLDDLDKVKELPFLEAGTRAYLIQNGQTYIKETDTDWYLDMSSVSSEGGYTKTEINALLATKADVANVYSKSETYNKDEVYNKTETYKKDEVYSKAEADARFQEDLVNGVGTIAQDTSVDVNVDNDTIKVNSSNQLYVDLTDELDKKQNIDEPTLKTVNKTIPGAINELYSKSSRIVRGTVGTDGEYPVLPTSGVLVGDEYIVVTSGDYNIGGETVHANKGDSFLALSTTPTWCLIPSGDDIYWERLTIINEKYEYTVSHTLKSSTVGIRLIDTDGEEFYTDHKIVDNSNVKITFGTLPPVGMEFYVVLTD